MRRSFYLPVHAGPVKCVAAAAPFVATGGADDTIHLFDVAAHADLGFLMSPGDGAVTAIAMYAPRGDDGAPGRPTHLLSGAADGGVTVWSAGADWAALKTLADHAKPITGVTVHDSGRVFLSADGGGGLRLWSLVKGKAQFKTRLPAPADALAFGPPPCGDAYALVAGAGVGVRSVAGGDGGSGGTDFVAPARQACLAWVAPHVLATGGDDGAVSLWDDRVGGGAVARVERAHGARVKGVAALAGTAAAAGFAADAALITSAAADGSVRLWDLRATGAVAAAAPTPLASVSASGARITCVAVVDAVAPSRAGAKLTPQQKSRRAKREAASAGEGAGAASATEHAPAPTPGSRPAVKIPNAKSRRKQLRTQVLAEAKAARKAGGGGGLPGPPATAPGASPPTTGARGKFAGGKDKKRAVQGGGVGKKKGKQGKTGKGAKEGAGAAKAAAADA